jgi:hypothetical protein
MILQPRVWNDDAANRAHDESGPKVREKGAPVKRVLWEGNRVAGVNGQEGPAEIERRNVPHIHGASLQEPMRAGQTQIH